MPTADTTSAGVPPPAGDLRVLTLNLWGLGGVWEDRRKVLMAGLRELRPDLVAFQEAVRTDDYDQAADLLGSDYHLAHQTDRPADGVGVTVASRWPLREVHELDLNVTPRTAAFACTTLVTEIDVPDPVGPLLFVNHLPNYEVDFEYERQLQAVTAARFITERAGRSNPHVVLAGDLDADPDASSIRFWSGRQALGGTSVCYRDAWESAHPGEPGHTFTPDNPLVADPDWPFRRIDYVFVRCATHGGPTLAIRHCSRVFTEPVGGVWASDHFGLLADLAAQH